MIWSAWVELQRWARHADTQNIGIKSSISASLITLDVKFPYNVKWIGDYLDEQKIHFTITNNKEKGYYRQFAILREN